MTASVINGPYQFWGGISVPICTCPKQKSSALRSHRLDDGPAEVIFRKWFRQIVVETRLEKSIAVLGHGVRRERNHRYVPGRLFALELAHDVDAIHFLTEIDIHQYNIERLFGGKGGGVVGRRHR